MRITWTLTALLVISSSVSAQPSNQFLRLKGFPQHGYIEIPADVLLDTPAMTVEAWVSVRDPRSGACSSIAGNGYTTGWWLGLCATTMRSYFNGTTSVKSGGVMPDTPKRASGAPHSGLEHCNSISILLGFTSNCAATRPPALPVPPCREW